MKKRPGPPSLPEIAARLVEAHVKRYAAGFGDMDEGDLRGFADEGATEALNKWDGGGVFDGFCAQRIRWGILRGVKRQILRHRSRERREQVCAVVAAERAAESYDTTPDEAPLPLPSTRGLMEEALSEYRMELAYAEELERIPDPSADVEHAAHRGELRRAIERLPPPEDIIVALHTYDDETFKDIGKAMGLSTSTVHDHYWRGRRRLMEAFGPKPEPERRSSPPSTTRPPVARVTRLS